MPDVIYEVSAQVATITLNRPERRNALTLPMLDLLAEVVHTADADPEARVIVLTGAGEGFCAGLDLVAAAAQGPGAVDEIATSYRPERIPILAMHAADKPIVAAVNGAAAGYGVGLALNADIRVMARRARFVPPTRRALVPESGDYTSLLDDERFREWLGTDDPATVYSGSLNDKCIWHIDVGITPEQGWQNQQ